MLRSLLVFLLLVKIKWISMIFYRFRGEWVGPPPPKRWPKVRVLAMLNHTSLYEPVFAGAAPYSLLWQFARHGVLPVAEKTIRRRIGLFFRFLARRVVVVTRQRDSTWDDVLNRIDREAVVMILPEGRMKRRDGLDASGRPMTVRGGIADVLEALSEGWMLIVYSGGLHHIQAPGELLPRPFRNVGSRFEFVTIEEYKKRVSPNDDPTAFRTAVIEDLTSRRDEHCPDRAEFLSLPPWKL